MGTLFFALDSMPSRTDRRPTCRVPTASNSKGPPPRSSFASTSGLCNPRQSYYRLAAQRLCRPYVCFRLVDGTDS
ncbi:RHTO0S13e05600g1_1 [Rhodotorula toruloides]|uniref:RHTO0S13e05600g1_1 n=2 Tax=Rhodotorula toruloides TaxID=5286 RepID=A0A061BAU9_RHOTO|nr:uncharacterized protein RHTO_00621 [Rhodotorula toruloides NP11]EMS22342.1 hypothetical protein RHTO_00621 [Rhodotorula toruloides NP11]CDR47067.1 RHTO0S13e05600g1_1 [Rhodotorula toruloides]